MSKDQNYTQQFEDVRDKENVDIAKRRSAHEPDKHNSAGGDNLVGLALSGGGVRSASFNLGLLQALFQGGLLKHIDYLSTVSGGGYVGSYLASLLQQKGVKVSPDDRALREQLVESPGQPDRVVKFVRHGKYLNHPDSFFNHYLVGLFFINLALFSGLACLCMGIACLWRVLDTNTVGGWLYLLSPKYLTELWRPFLPAALCFSVWLLVWLAAYGWAWWRGRRPSTWVTKWLLIATGICLLVGVAVVLATPVISIPTEVTDNGVNEGSIEVSEKQRVVSTSIISLIVAALTPFLNPQRLLRSGIHPQSVWERRLFVVATSALVAGVPFILIWWFAHHDFSGSDMETRDRALAMGDINYRKWNAFWERIDKEGEDPRTPGRFIKTALSRSETIAKALANKEVMKSLAKLPVPVDRGEFALKKEIIDSINQTVVNDPAFGRHAVLSCWCGGLGGEPNALQRETVLDARIRDHAERHRIRALVDRLESNQLIEDDSKELNRLLLEVCYPDEVLPRMRVYRPNIIEKDQYVRLRWFAVLLGVFLVAGFVNLNATSLHSFYRNQLARTFIEPIENKNRTISLSKLDTTTPGGPYFLYSATLNRRPSDRDPSMFTRRKSETVGSSPPANTPAQAPDQSKLGPEHPGETATETFLLSRHFCGSASLGYRRTASFMNDRLELDDAMAISGAAFSPVQTGNPFIGFLMTVFNMRLGQWVRAPRLNPRGEWTSLSLRAVPTVYRLLWNQVSRLWGRQAWYFLTDGGHHENLGLWPLLERRCRLIIVSDASQDGDSGFVDLLRVIRRARFERGIRIVGASIPGPCDEEQGLVTLLTLLRPTRELTLLRSAENDQARRDAELGRAPDKAVLRESKRHFFLARIKYPDDEKPAYLIYLKPTLTGDESVELQGYALLNKDFPHNPTLDQLYDEDRFESYRQLGEHIGRELCRELVDVQPRNGPLWGWSLSSDALLICRGLADRQEECFQTVEREDPRGIRVNVPCATGEPQ